MARRNILREKSDIVKNLFIKDLTATTFDSDSYINVSQPPAWRKNNSLSTQFMKIDTQDFEKSLIGFFEFKHVNKIIHPIKVIVGHAGSGKSTTIKYALNQADICKGCHIFDSCKGKKDERIIIDYIDCVTETIGGEPLATTKEENTQKLIDTFWQHLIKILDDNLNDQIQIKNELAEYFKWIIKQKFIDNKLYRILYPDRDLLEDPINNSEAIRQLRRRIYKELSTKDLAHYKLFQIAYIRSQNNRINNCNILVFDNIDTLGAIFQRKLVDFAKLASELLNSKAVIPMRPSTLKFYIHATNVIDQIDHWSPSLEKVINKRLKVYSIANGKDEIYLCIKEIIDAIWKNKKFKSIFLGTCKSSIRFGLRNLYNLLISNYIITHIENKRVEQDQGLLLTSRLTHAFFCSENPNELLYESSFVNMLSLRIGQTQIISTIKLRILHIIHSKGSISLKDLKIFIDKYCGHNPSAILNCLNDLLDVKKALIHSSSFAMYSKEILYSQDSNDHMFNLSEVGVYYYEELLNDFNYIYECIVATKSNKQEFGYLRILHTLNTLTSIVDDLDTNEVKTYLRNHKRENYEIEYSLDDISISSILVNKLSKDLKRLINYLNNPSELVKIYEKLINNDSIPSILIKNKN